MTKTSKPVFRVVMLVDSKARDLSVAALIAHHLGTLGVECILEPLEAWRAVLSAHRPDLIIFNHLSASHLARFSRRLNSMGVLTAVLSNEGINYDPDSLRYNSGQFHADAHIDWFFCWNEPHRQTLMEVRPDRGTHIEVIGVPRFDFYRQPWARVFYRPASRVRTRSRILLCTNFQLAKFAKLPAEHGDKLFAQWKDRIPVYRDYRRAFEAHRAASEHIFSYLDALAQCDQFDLVLRPHPREDVEHYRSWYTKLPSAKRERVTLDATSSITSLILGCDLEISCETCTTALESWIAGKPTVELIFAKHPLLYYTEHARQSTPCDAPEKLVPLISQILEQGEPAELKATRQLHLAKWCHVADGNACLRMAQLVAQAIKKKEPADWLQLTFSDWRRGLKLKLLRSLGLPYNFDLLLPLKMRLNPGRYAIKRDNYRKAITPADVEKVHALLKAALS